MTDQRKKKFPEGFYYQASERREKSAQRFFMTERAQGEKALMAINFFDFKLLPLS